MEIIFGGRTEKNGQPHGKYQAQRRNISESQIKLAIEESDSLITQSVDCKRYFKKLGHQTLVVVAVNQENEVYEVITCYWKE